VREVEALVKKAGSDVQSIPKKNKVNHDVMALENSLSERLGTGVAIAAKANGSGTLKINYSNLDQLDALIKMIKG
jgi:ParB family transcriptional regulator, chromosome partitioning protein